MTGEARASHRATAAILRAGAGIAGAGFFVGLGSALVRGGPDRGEVALMAIPAGLLALDPSSWLTASALVLIGTPAAALVATAFEFARVDRRFVAICAILFCIFGGSVLLASRI